MRTALIGLFAFLGGAGVVGTTLADKNDALEAELTEAKAYALEVDIARAEATAACTDNIRAANEERDAHEAKAAMHEVEAVACRVCEEYWRTEPQHRGKRYPFCVAPGEIDFGLMEVE
jgi:hypothetical protein